jgi:type VI secretion system VasD/TssJ family lipoprotein
VTRSLSRLLGLGLLVAVVTVGCPCRKPAPPAPPPPPPVYNLCIEASPQLNWYSASAHTLYVRIFQLASLEAFEQAEPGRLLDTQAALPGLQGTPIERTVYPGSKLAVEIRQQPGAQYLGVVTGYYKLDGAAKTSREMTQPTGAKAAGQKDCLRLGPNAIEMPPR